MRSLEHFQRLARITRPDGSLRRNLLKQISGHLIGVMIPGLMKCAPVPPVWAAWSYFVYLGVLDNLVIGIAVKARPLARIL